MTKEELTDLIANLYKLWREDKFIIRKGRMCTFEGAQFHIRDRASGKVIKADSIQEAISFLV